MDINEIVKIVCIMITLVIMTGIVFRWVKRGHDLFEGILWLALFGSFIYSTHLLVNVQINQAHDMISSMSRINDMAIDIGSKTFPTIILTGQANGFGCAGILYPHLFYYIPSFVRFLGASTVCSYQVFIWFCQLMGAFVMFGSVKLILSCMDAGKDDYPAIVASLLFLCYPYRVANLYWRGAMSESYAMIFIPLLLASLICVIKGRKNTDWIYLCLAITGILQTHILTLVMAVAISMIMCLVFVKDVIKKNVLISFAVAVSVAVIINLWYIVPFLKYYTFGSNVDELVYQMSHYGMTFSGLLKGISYDESRPGIIGVVGFLILIVDMVYTVVVISKKTHELHVRKFILFMTAVAVVSLFASTKYFPWDWFQGIFPLVGIFQFPMRFILITCVLSTTVFSMFIYDFIKFVRRENKTGQIVAAYTLLVVTGIFLVVGAANIFSCLDVNEELFDYSTNDFSFDYRIEYLPQGADSSYFADANPFISDGVETTYYYKDNKELVWQYSTDRENGFFQAPLLYYPGYNAAFLDVYGNYITALETKRAANYRVQVDLPKGYDSGIITITFDGLWYFKYCTIISMIGVVGFIVYIVLAQHLVFATHKCYNNFK